MVGKDIDEEIKWWKDQSNKQKHEVVQMVCWGVATGLKMAKEDYNAGLTKPKPRVIK